ncbi:glycoside hydrolase family 71/99-like protein [Paraflavitalea sp. CAU 1676]|uniref:glycoside hydrolase family 71/99-like protein n=1 Tax=Paraflavitalea sp. CAU 1676 TaxID=3032598 RepID=UPI0023DCC161|nr:glycoside hydrolase family 71/99-like protein [Paraflavitalea sp. CAU 1676]MDF2187847.1 glycoside hydrolase family 71/99-like protein [Paraflavitalea sp. CAU 1676]
MRILPGLIMMPALCVVLCCSKKGGNNPAPPDPPEPPPVKEVVYDETGCLYTSYDKLVMAGYQGWFAAQGDASERGWYHYQNGNCGGFLPGCSSVDFWPDISEYTKKYKSPFQFANGTDAYLYSPYDEESVDLHFKWMKDYGIDGVFMQRFVGEIKPDNVKGKRHFNKVLENALKAAKKYSRAICVMYDLSGCSPEDVAYLEQDWNELQSLFALFDNKQNPTYLRHNKKPLVVIWGVGFNDNRKYTTSDVDKLVDKIKGPTKKVSVMLGVPYYWRSLKNDTDPSAALHTLIKKCDIVLPWAVGRYGNDNYNNVAGLELIGDMQWCATNNITYVPLVFPGFSWGNLKMDATQYNSIPRYKGDFLWKQVAGAKNQGAQSLYVAMFDEIDEGTAIYKCARESELPLHGSRKFVGIENEVASDYYLWLTGEAGKWFHGAAGYTATKPIR